MKTVLFAIAFIGYVQCAKLDHLKYLPPDNRPTNKESFDQGLAAPESGPTQSSPFARGFQPQTEESSSVGPESGSFNAGSRNAAQLQGAPFIVHGFQGTTGTFRSDASQPTQGFPTGQQNLNIPKTTDKSQASSGIFGISQQSPQSSAAPQPQGSYGSSGYQASNSFGGDQSARPQNTGNLQGSAAYNNNQQDSQVHNGPQKVSQPQSSANNFQGSTTYGSARAQQSNQPQGDTQGSQLSDTQSAQPYDFSYTQKSTFGKSVSSSTFPEITKSGSSISQDSSFPKSGPVGSNYNSPTISGSSEAGSRPSGSFGSFTGSSFSKHVSAVGSHSTDLQQNLPGFTGGYQQGPQSSRSFGTTYSKPNQESGSFEPGIPSDSLTKGYFTQTQSKYQPSSLNQIPIIKLDTKNYGDGTYSHVYETGNGIQAEEQGQTQGDNSIAQGSFSYTSPEGEKVGVSYTADEDGYHPQGEHLPTPPPIPEAILKSIEYNMAHPEEENDDASYSEPNAPESSGQYKSSFSKTQFSGSSRNYLAPVLSSASGPSANRNSFSLSESKIGFLPSSTFKGSTSGSGLLPSGPSSNQPNFSTSGYSSPSLNNNPEEKTGPSGSASLTSNYAGYSATSNDKKQAPSASGYQDKAFSSFGSSSEPSKDFSFGSSKSSQGASVNRPTQKSTVQNAFSSYSGFNSPSSAPGPKSGSFFGKGPDAPRGGLAGQSDYHNSIVVSADSPVNSNDSQDSKTSSFNPNVRQQSASGQVSFQSSSSGPSYTPNTKSNDFLSPLLPNSQHSTVSGQPGYQLLKNQPFKASIVPQNTENENFGVGGQISAQYQGTTQSPRQQNNQASYFAKPSAAKLSPSSGYQYNAPNIPSGNSVSSISQQGQHSVFGATQGSKGSPIGQFGSGPAPTKTVGEFGSGGYASSNTPFGNSGSSKFQQGAKHFTPENTPVSRLSSVGQFVSGPGPSKIAEFESRVSGQSKIVGEFGAGVAGDYSRPRTPGVQLQDANGGYLY